MGQDMKFHHYSSFAAMDVAAAERFLVQNELLNNVPLGVLIQTRDLARVYPNYESFTISDASGIVMFAHHTAPRPLALSLGSPKACELLGQELTNRRFKVSGIHGERSVVDIVLQHWQSEFAQIKSTDTQLSYRLDQLIPAKKTGATIVIAGVQHRELLIDWVSKFEIEVGMPAGSSLEHEKWADRCIEQQKAYLAVKAGEPVALVCKSRLLPHGQIIGPVFTPTAHRGCGYASELTAHVSDTILANGKDFAGLFTQSVNPISNRIYVNLGYKHVGDFVHHRF